MCPTAPQARTPAAGRPPARAVWHHRRWRVEAGAHAARLTASDESLPGPHPPFAPRRPQWRPGEALIFDDAFEHSVWNDGDEERALLLFDLWHPDLTVDEITAVKAMFREVEGIKARRDVG